MINFNDLDTVFPFLKGMLSFTISENVWVGIEKYLVKHDVRIYDICMDTISKDEFLFEASKSFGITDYFAKNWDAFNDSFLYFIEKLEKSHDPVQIAIVLHCPSIISLEKMNILIDGLIYFTSHAFNSLSIYSNDNISLFVVYAEENK